MHFVAVLVMGLQFEARCDSLTAISRIGAKLKEIHLPLLIDVFQEFYGLGLMNAVRR